MYLLAMKTGKQLNPVIVVLKERRDTFFPLSKKIIDQGCQMVYLYTQNANFNAYLKALGWKILVHFIVFWYIVGIAIWYFSGNLGTFFPFWFIVQRKNWQSWSSLANCSN
jgi:hypothetical protein